MPHYRPLRSDELDAAIRLVLESPDCDTVQLQERIQAFRSYATLMGLELSHQWGAFDKDTLVSTCLCILSPGRTGMIFLPANRRPHDMEIIGELLRNIVRDAARSDTQLLQSLISVNAPDDEAALKTGGLYFLAELVYMQRDAGDRFDDPPPADFLKWMPYSPETHRLFSDTVVGTYAGSLDCPGLSGLRTVEDIMASHRASGEFDPNRWGVAFFDGKPAGVLLMSRMPGRDILDVVYMGLLPNYRGRGIGKAVLYQAVQWARRYHCDWITLAVDSANTPAMRLYQRSGFTETSRRCAWIACPPRTHTSA